MLGSNYSSGGTGRNLRPQTRSCSFKKARWGNHSGSFRSQQTNRRTHDVQGFNLCGFY